MTTTAATVTLAHDTHDRSEWSIDELFLAAAQIGFDIVDARNTRQDLADLPAQAAKLDAHISWLTAEAVDVQAEIARRRKTA